MQSLVPSADRIVLLPSVRNYNGQLTATAAADLLSAIH
jgi:hypothetical protein